jgi:hypothetical protein
LSSSSEETTSAIPSVITRLASGVVRPRNPIATKPKIAPIAATAKTAITPASHVGTSGTSQNVKSPPITAKAPWAKLMMFVVR